MPTTLPIVGEANLLKARETIAGLKKLTHHCPSGASLALLNKAVELLEDYSEKESLLTVSYIVCGDFKGEEKQFIPHCPACNKSVSFKPYCANCGRPLDWSREKEVPCGRSK